MNKNEAKRAFDKLWTLRNQWLPVWRELGRYLAPERGMFDEDESRAGQAKKINASELINASPCQAVDVLCAGMISGLTSPSLRWFFLRTKDIRQDPGGAPAQWLQEVQETMENVLEGAGIYNALHNFYKEIVVFGTGAFIVEEDPETVVRAVPLTIGEYAVDTDAKGRPCRFVRKFKMTAAQLKEMFGPEHLPEQVKNQLNNKNFTSEHDVYHLVAPNNKRVNGKRDNKNMPFASVYWMDGMQEDFLRVGGYEEFPLVCARWQVKNNAQVYGKSPSWTAIGDVKMLQKMEKTKLVALDKITNPPMMVSSAVQGLVNLNPGGITRYNGQTDPGVRPAYGVQIDLGALQNAMAEVIRRINGMFYTDLFLMLTGADYGKMTATEVQARMQEKMMVLGPVLQRLKDELLDPLLKRVFNICWRLNLFPAPPEEMQDARVNIEYVSVIAQAQKSATVQSITQGVGFAQNLAAVDPNVLDLVDFDESLKEAYKSMGVPAGMLRSSEEVAQLRAGRAQAQAQAAQMQQAQALAEGAKTLSETPVGTGSALDELAAAAQEIQ